MSRIYRALEKAEREKERVATVPRNGEESVKFWEDLPSTILLDKKPGRVPGLGQGEENILIASTDSYPGEQFRKLKTHIFLNPPKPPRCLLVTSAVAQEGKTTVAMNLAVTMAEEINKKVILVDADLRMPSIALGHPAPSKGLAGYLTDPCDLSEALIASEEGKFWIMPAGLPSAKAPELIGSKKMEELVERLKSFDEDAFVIIDSPPIIATSEAVLLSKWMDGVLFVVMADRAPKGIVRKAIEAVGRQNILGIVFNLKDSKGGEHYPHYYYRNHKK